MRQVGPDAIQACAALVGLTKNRSPAPSYHLCALGVPPARQGRGIGSELLVAALARCDRERIPASVDTSPSRICALYERHGFVDVGPVDLTGGPTLRRLWRDPVTDTPSAG